MSEKPTCQVLDCDKKTAPGFTVCYSHLEGSFLGAFRTKQAHADLATRVAADIFGRWASTWADNLDIPDEFATDAANDSVRLGRIFAEAVAKEGK